MIDYKMLLTKYLDHIYMIHGKTYAAPQFQKGQYVQVMKELVISKEEWDELRKLEKWKPGE